MIVVRELTQADTSTTPAARHRTLALERRPAIAFWNLDSRIQKKLRQTAQTTGGPDL
jgi:hypothetical protein